MGFKSTEERREYFRAWAKRNAELGLCKCSRPRLEGHRCCLACVIHHRRTQKITWARLKAQAFAAYGDVCRCCKEHRRQFLTVDHVNNDGASHRRSIGARTVYAWLARHNYPGGFQILCWNCNAARHIHRRCPHEVERDDRATFSPRPPLVTC